MMVRLLTIKEASIFLKEDWSTVTKKLQAGEIPAYKVGRNWKIPDTLLQKYMEDKALYEAANRRRLNDEMEQKKVQGES